LTVQGSGFRGSKVLGSGFWVLGSEVQRFWVLGSGFWVLGSKVQRLKSGEFGIMLTLNQYYVSSESKSHGKNDFRTYLLQSHHVAHDLCHSRIGYFRNAIDLDREDRAKRYHKSSIFNLQSSIPVYPDWDIKES
jgi:hypothetical protein